MEENPFPLLEKIEETLNRHFRTLSQTSGPFLTSDYDVTWAAGIEMEGTYVFNPLDTKEDWEKSFEKFYVPNADEILTYINRKGYSKEKYPLIVEAESSGRTCRGISVVEGDPVNSMFEIATDRPYQAFRPLTRAPDALWYSSYIQDLQETLIKDLNDFYYEETLWKKKKKFFSIVPYPFAMTDRLVNADGILVPGEKEKKPKTNYTGSYHLTLTLPFSYSRTTLGDYLEMYRRYISQFQWIEPLVLAMYSTVDMRGVGNNLNYPRASYRIMLIGWGNPGGSDVRKFEEGLNRKANIELYWRKGLDFIGQKKLEKACANKKEKYPPKYVDPARNVYDMGADFRTPMTRDIPKKYLARLSVSQRKKLIGETKEEQWRMVGKWLKLPTDIVWGDRDKPPSKLFGVEMRILDYFPPRYMSSFLRMIVFLAENSRRTPNQLYVYQDEDWIGAMHAVMKKGWRAKLPRGYIEKLEQALDLQFPKKPQMAEAFWGVFLKVLYQRNCDGFYVREMFPEKFSGEPQEQHRIPTKNEKQKRIQPPLISKNVNRDSWDFAFLLELIKKKSLRKKVLSFVNALPENKNLPIENLKKYLKKLPLGFRNEQWKDIVYFLYFRDGLTIRVDTSGFLAGIHITDHQKDSCKKIMDNLIGEIVKLWPETIIYANGGDREKNN
jgi:hypothetical protein